MGSKEGQGGGDSQFTGNACLSLSTFSQGLTALSVDFTVLIFVLVLLCERPNTHLLCRSLWGHKEERTELTLWAIRGGLGRTVTQDGLVRGLFTSHPCRHRSLYFTSCV